MSASGILGDKRQFILGRCWREDATQESLPVDAPGALGTGQLPSEDSALPGRPPKLNDEAACLLAEMTVVEDGLPFGFHYVDQRDRWIGYAA
jgi:hypothetical protein